MVRNTQQRPEARTHIPFIRFRTALLVAGPEISVEKVSMVPVKEAPHHQRLAVVTEARRRQRLVALMVVRVFGRTGNQTRGHGNNIIHGMEVALQMVSAAAQQLPLRQARLA